MCRVCMCQVCMGRVCYGPSLLCAELTRHPYSLSKLNNKTISPYGFSILSNSASHVFEMIMFIIRYVGMLTQRRKN